ncbi:hypothetical protein [Providencia sp. PROV255]|uniref:hypothetical protein n=1 Tax=Providencia sp. PROV255 TaxID=2949943 RepID=UPI00234BBA1A|nr:hypothetical protein [Providencia sp. PROV255]
MNDLLERYVGHEVGVSFFNRKVAGFVLVGYSNGILRLKDRQAQHFVPYHAIVRVVEQQSFQEEKGFWKPRKFALLIYISQISYAISTY